MRDTERERQRHRRREKQGPCRKPDAGLDPRTPGSQPEPEADAQPLSHPGIPIFHFLKQISLIYSEETQRERGRDIEREAGSMQEG